MINEEQNNLVATYDEQNKIYVIKNFEAVKDACSKFIDENAHLELIVNDKTSRDLLYKARTKIRNKTKEISSKRISLNNDLVGTINDQFKSLEAMLKAADQEMTFKINTYDAMQEPSKPATISLIITSDNVDAIESVKKYAIRKGCKVTEK